MQYNRYDKYNRLVFLKHKWRRKFFPAEALAKFRLTGGVFSVRCSGSAAIPLPLFKARVLERLPVLSVVLSAALIRVISGQKKAWGTGSKLDFCRVASRLVATAPYAGIRRAELGLGVPRKTTGSPQRSAQGRAAPDQ
jgi:hypothetical protein